MLGPPHLQGDIKLCLQNSPLSTPLPLFFLSLSYRSSASPAPPRLPQAPSPLYHLNTPAMPVGKGNTMAIAMFVSSAASSQIRANGRCFTPSPPPFTRTCFAAFGGFLLVFLLRVLLATSVLTDGSLSSSFSHQLWFVSSDPGASRLTWPAVDALHYDM